MSDPQTDRLMAAPDEWVAARLELEAFAAALNTPVELVREAQDGDTCTFCGEPFAPGTLIDTLFIAAHAECVLALPDEIGGKEL